jgi:hypothetical protein
MYLPFDAVYVVIREGRYAPNAKYRDEINGANIIGVESGNQEIRTGAYLTDEYGCAISKGDNIFFADVPAGTLPDRATSEQPISDRKSVVNIRDIQVKLSNAILRSYASASRPHNPDSDKKRGVA